MTDQLTGPQADLPDESALASDLEDFAQQIADQVTSFLLALRAISRGEATGGQAVSLLLLEVSQVLLAGGRLGVHEDFQPADEYEPDAGPDPDLDAMRLRLAVLLESVDAYTEVFDPYVDPPEIMSSLLSDDLTSIATALAHGLQPPRGRPRRRGAVVVAVLLRRLLGHRGQRGAARTAVRGLPRPARCGVRERAGAGRGRRRVPRHRKILT